MSGPSRSAAAGKVYLVGAGPGDPRLVTLRAVECLAKADVVLYDALANVRLLDYAPDRAERILVGKRRGKVTVAQAEIERMLVEHACAGRTVVRLKGGDPFVFGRGGEEAEACRSAGVPFEVVPGVTSASAAPAYAGIPLTHREHASIVTLVTGQPGEARGEVVHDWGALVRTGGTLVFLMATIRAAEIGQELIGAGMDPQTPAAAVRWGTTPRQSTIVATVSTLGERIEAEHMRPPVTIIVGGVVALAERIGWFESLPLFGKRIVVTRARHQSRELTCLLEEVGAEVVEFPVIQIAEPTDRRPLVEAFACVGEYDWLVLTSVNGAQRFFEEFLAEGHDIRELAGVGVAAIGPATAGVVVARGIRVAAQPSEYRAEALLEALGDVSGKRVLLARAEAAREILPDQLRKRGADVDVIALYRTVLPDVASGVGTLEDVDMITFTSSSTVTNFDRLCNGKGAEILARCAVAAIGPITARTLEGAGVDVDAMPSSYTIADLAREITSYFANRRGLK